MPGLGAYVPQVRQLAFDRGGQAGDNHEAGFVRLQPFDQGMIVKPFVGADDHRSDPGRDLREAGREEVECPAGGMRIAGPQLAMPEVLALALEAEQRVIRWPAALDRIVADPRLLLVAIDDQHRGVDIEDQSRRWPWLNGHPVKTAVVQDAQLRQGGGRHAKQEPPERGRIGIARQAGEVLKHAILPQQVGRFDPFESEDHRVEQGQQHLADAVAVVPLDQAHLAGHRILEPNSRQEPMEQIRTTIVGEVPFAKRNRKPSGASGHHGESYF